MKTFQQELIRTPAPQGKRTAREIMTPNPISIRRQATVQEAAAILAQRGISAAPVIDEAGRPTGVVSSTDIVAYQASRQLQLQPLLEADERTDGTPALPGDLKALCRSALLSTRPISALMTPAVFCVRPATPVGKVAEKMAKLKVRRLFVVDESGVLIGVISALDILHELYAPEVSGN